MARIVQKFGGTSVADIGRIKRAATVLLLFVASFSAHAESYDANLTKDMPQDVAAFLDRQGMCWHFGGEWNEYGNNNQQ